LAAQDLSEIISKNFPNGYVDWGACPGVGTTGLGAHLNNESKPDKPRTRKGLDGKRCRVKKNPGHFSPGAFVATLRCSVYASGN
jgi:hypothetical protein